MELSYHNDKTQVKIIHIVCGVLLLHAVLIFIRFELDFSNKTAIQESSPIEIVDFDKFAGIKEKLAKTRAQRQIVNSDQASNSKLDKSSRFLGKKTQSFDRESIANKIESYKKAGKGEDGKSLKVGDGKEASTKPKTLEKLSLSQLGSLPIAPKKAIAKAGGKKEGLFNGDAKSKGRGSNNDFIEDVPLGDFTRLNTVEFKYFGFYERIRGKLEQYWGRSLREKAKAIYANGRRLPANENFITSLIITLNSAGEIVGVKMVGSSGKKELDDAAVESFNQAGPFPNPPRGMIKGGLANIKWSFVVKS